MHSLNNFSPSALVGEFSLPSLIPPFFLPERSILSHHVQALSEPSLFSPSQGTMPPFFFRRLLPQDKNPDKSPRYFVAKLPTEVEILPDPFLRKHHPPFPTKATLSPSCISCAKRNPPPLKPPSSTVLILFFLCFGSRKFDSSICDPPSRFFLSHGKFSPFPLIIPPPRKENTSFPLIGEWIFLPISQRPSRRGFFFSRRSPPLGTNLLGIGFSLDLSLQIASNSLLRIFFSPHREIAFDDVPFDDSLSTDFLFWPSVSARSSYLLRPMLQNDPLPNLDLKLFSLFQLVESPPFALNSKTPLSRIGLTS